MTPLIVLVTAASAEEAARIGRALVEQNLAACANIVPGITSIYRWKGKIEEGAEHLLLIKSSRELWDPLQTAIKALHRYECPEIVAVEPAAISADYAAWWAASIPL
jgi:periplasmic divalent cation tolerance protein